LKAKENLIERDVVHDEGIVFFPHAILAKNDEWGRRLNRKIEIYVERAWKMQQE